TKIHHSWLCRICFAHSPRGNLDDRHDSHARWQTLAGSSQANLRLRDSWRHPLLLARKIRRAQAAHVRIFFRDTSALAPVGRLFSRKRQRISNGKHASFHSRIALSVRTSWQCYSVARRRNPLPRNVEKVSKIPRQRAVRDRWAHPEKPRGILVPPALQGFLGR